MSNWPDVHNSEYDSIIGKLGQEILDELKIPWQKIERVDLTADGMRGWSEYTPEDTSYPVVVYYTDGDGKSQHAEKVYGSMSTIVKRLEEIAEDWHDSLYD